MTALAAYVTKKSEAELRKILRQKRAELDERYPGFVKRLLRLSDAEFDAAELACLRLLPPTPATDYQIRLLETLAYCRAHPTPIRRYRPDITDAKPAVAAVQINESRVSVTPAPAAPETLPATPAGPADATPIPAPERPSNVVLFRSKAFHGGKELGSERWIGGEVPEWPGS